MEDGKLCSPPKVSYANEKEYREHYERVYCRGPIVTFDGIKVYFRKTQFIHCMFESSKHDSVKDKFSYIRAERIDWIKATLLNPKADLYQGWDKDHHTIDRNKRIAVMYENFVVIIRMKRKSDGSITKAYFVTAYQADNSIGKIRSNPRWIP